MLKPFVLVAAAALPAAASAQPAPVTAWRVSAGYDTFTFRDVAKSSPPIDAAPVGWRGSGPIVTLDYERDRPLRLHRFEATVSTSGDFQYDTGVGLIARPDDSARFLEGQYEYRRYLARRIVISGLQAGAGVRGIGERRSLNHHYGGPVELRQSDTSGSIAIVAALRFRRWDRFTGEVEWSNAATLTHSRQQHESTVLVEQSSWGAGWRTDLLLRPALRVTRAASVVAAYATNGEGWLFNHRSYTSERRRWMLGVSFAR